MNRRFALRDWFHSKKSAAIEMRRFWLLKHKLKLKQDYGLRKVRLRSHQNVQKGEKIVKKFNSTRAFVQCEVWLFGSIRHPFQWRVFRPSGIPTVWVWYSFS